MAKRGHSSAAWAAALALAGALAACAHGGGEEGAAIGGELAGGAWRAEEIGGRDVLDAAPSTLVFGAEGRVSGEAACNRFHGAATIAGDRLGFGPLATTRRACPPAVMDQERRFLGALAASERFARDGAHLVLYDAGGRPLVRFTRATAPS